MSQFICKKCKKDHEPLEEDQWYCEKCENVVDREFIVCPNFVDSEETTVDEKISPSEKFLPIKKIFTCCRVYCGKVRDNYSCVGWDRPATTKNIRRKSWHDKMPQNSWICCICHNLNDPIEEKCFTFFDQLFYYYEKIDQKRFAGVVVDAEITRVPSSRKVVKCTHSKCPGCILLP